jgi:hypothetical protein
MSVANPLWGSATDYGELLKLGIDVGQTTVAKYMARKRRPPSQGWKTFLRNHADCIASIDLFVVLTISLRLFYALLVLRHSRPELLWLVVTAHPSAKWIARQLTEARGWSEPPRYIIHDGDGAYGDVRFRDAEPLELAPIGGIVEVRRIDVGAQRGLTLAARSDLPIKAQITAVGATWLDHQFRARGSLCRKPASVATFAKRSGRGSIGWKQLATWPRGCAPTGQHWARPQDRRHIPQFVGREPPRARQATAGLQPDR